MSEKLLKLN